MHKYLCDKYLDKRVDGKCVFNSVWTEKATGTVVVSYNQRCPMWMRVGLRLSRWYGDWDNVKFVKRPVIDALVNRKAKHRPAFGGISIGHVKVSAGTIGLPVEIKDGDVPDGTYFLTNNHVAANSNDAVVGDTVLQQGDFDGGVDPRDKVGELAAFVPIKFDGSPNTVDLAIVGPLKDGDWKKEIADVDYPTKTFGAGPGNEVFKSGRTSLVTDGLIIADDGATNINYGDNGEARYVDQLIIEPRKGETPKCKVGRFGCLLCFIFKNVFPFCPKPVGPPFLLPGDSGSAVLTKHRGESKLVGVAFAGNDTISVANKRDNVMPAFAGMKLL